MKAVTQLIFAVDTLREYAADFSARRVARGSCADRAGEGFGISPVRVGATAACFYPGVGFCHRLHPAPGGYDEDLCAAGAGVAAEHAGDPGGELGCDAVAGGVADSLSAAGTVAVSRAEHCIQRQSAGRSDRGCPVACAGADE